MALRKMSGEEFAHLLKEVSGSNDRRYALFLGAGCSTSSGIPDAAGLVRDRWLPRLRDRRARHRTDLDVWAKEEFKYDPRNPAASYGTVMEELFFEPAERQLELESLCDGRFPGFGYAALATLVAREGGHFNVILTTNFDDLMADALYLFTAARPLVIQHESLASYIRPTRTRPLVVKLHGDHRLAPHNTPDETSRLKEDIERQVHAVLHDRGLIFVGYGGRDEGIRKMLEALPAEALQWGVFWASDREPAGPMREWLASRNAKWVCQGDFDELMLLVRDAFNLPHPNSKRFDDVFEGYFNTYKKLSAPIASRPDTGPATKALKEAVKRTDQAFTDWWAVQIAADRVKESDPERADAIYQEGLKQFPGCGPLLGNYAIFLTEIRKDYDRAEDFFRRAINADPNHATNLGNYAIFLKNIRKDYDRAEEYYRRAIDADPNDADYLGNYALFLDDIRKDYDRAEEYFRRAIDADPNHADYLGNYALFLDDIRKDYDRAEEFYRRAIDADPNHANNLGNYALFLDDIRKDCDRAEEFYRRAIDADPGHAGRLGNYAVFLTNIRNDYDRAEEFYRRAIDTHPNGADYLGNYAVFLTNIRKDYDRAEEFYRRAIDTHPNGADYLDNYAVFLMNIRRDYDRAEEFFRRAIDADPNHANSLGNYAGFLLALGRRTEGLAALASVLALPALQEKPSLAAECWFYAFTYRPKRERPEALHKLKGVLTSGGRSPGWALSRHVERARQDGDPDAGWIEKLAAVISDGADIAILDDWPAWRKAKA